MVSEHAVPAGLPARRLFLIARVRWPPIRLGTPVQTFGLLATSRQRTANIWGPLFGDNYFYFVLPQRESYRESIRR